MKKNFKRRTVAKVLAFLMVITMVLSVPVTPSAATDIYGIHTYSGTGATRDLTDGSFYPFNYTVKFDFDWLIYGNNEVYYSDLGQLAAVVSNEAYSKNVNFLTTLGFDDAKYIITESTNGYDTDDVAYMAVGHKKLIRDGKTYEIILVSLRGSKTVSDWASNLDMGADTQRYTDLTGAHPEWLDSQKAMHKGFAVSANRAKAAIDSYISQKVDSSAEKIIMVTGHSRGGSIANILGTFYEDDKKNYAKSFTYTIGAATTTTVSAESAAAYKTIFNLQNTDDFVPYVPSDKWGGFRLYGTNLSANAANYSALFKTVSENDYSTAGGSSTAETLSGLASSRDGLYAINKNDSSCKVEKIGTPIKSLAESDASSLTSNLTEYGLINYADIQVESYEVLFVTNYRAVVYYCPTYLVRFGLYLANSGKSNSEMLGEALTYPVSTTHINLVLNAVSPFLDNSASCAHNTTAYYCIATNNFGYDQTGFLPEGSLPYLNRYISELSTEVTNTAECWAKIEKAKDMYDALSAEQKGRVVNYDKIESMEVAYLNLYISDLSTDVSYTAECWAKIEKAFDMYDALTASQKGGVVNFEKIEAMETAFYGLEATKTAQTLEVVICSRCKGSDLSVAHITGGGMYEPIAGGKINAPAETDGFTFVGWYTGCTAESIGTLYSDKTAIRVKPSENVSLTAVYEPKADTTFTVNITADNYTVADGSGSAEIKAGTSSRTVIPGTILTVTYTDENNVPVFWQDSNGTIVGRGAILDIPVTGDSTVTVFTIPKSVAAISAYVLFLDADGNTLSCNVCTSFQTITFPEAPEIENMTFTGWDMTEAQIQAEMAKSTEVVEVVVRPIYKAAQP